MKILLFLNNDIHSATALNLLFQDLLSHQVKIILSEKVGNIDNLPSELLKMKKFEQDEMGRLFAELDAENERKNKFKTFAQIAKIFATEISI